MGDSAQINRTWDFGFLQMTFQLVLLVQKLVSHSKAMAPTSARTLSCGVR